MHKLIIIMMTSTTHTHHSCNDQTRQQQQKIVVDPSCYTSVDSPKKTLPPPLPPEPHSSLSLPFTFASLNQLAVMMHSELIIFPRVHFMTPGGVNRRNVSNRFRDHGKGKGVERVRGVGWE